MARQGLHSQQISGYPVYPYIDTTNDTVSLSVVILKGPFDKENRDEIFGESVNAELIDIDGNELAKIKRPESGALSEIVLTSASVNPKFVFKKSPKSLKTLRFTLREETKEFPIPPISFAIPFINFFNYLWRLFSLIINTLILSPAGWIIGIFSSRCCAIGVDFPKNRTGQQADITFGYLDLHEDFDMTATFDDNSPCRSEHCEYRQKVRGTYVVNGEPHDHRLKDGLLDARIYREDSVPNALAPDTFLRYGYRSDPQTSGDIYTNPDRATGANYKGHDSVGFITNNISSTIEILLEYQGRIIDVHNNNRIVYGKAWRVHLSYP